MRGVVERDADACGCGRRVDRRNLDTAVPRRAEPEFSANLLRTLRKGAVQLRFTVMPDGSVTDPAVVTSTHARLNPSAPAAIAQWRSSPLRKPLAGLIALDLD